jgi:hypothetical protein
MQGLIYGNLGNFYGNEDAYADAHEHAHNTPRMFYSGVVIDELSKMVHESLGRLAGYKSLSGEEIDQLWETYSETNQYMSELVKKFEPVEEIYATYMGMRFSPPQVRNAVKGLVKEELGKRNWLEAYEAFAEVCDNANSSGWVALILFDCVCRMLEKIDMDGAKLLEIFVEKEILDFMCTFGILERVPGLKNDQDELEDIVEKCQLLLEQLNVPYEGLLSVCETWRDIELPMTLREDINLASAQHIRLIGYHADKYILPIITDEKRDYESNISDPQVRLALESLRQQLCQLCSKKVVKIVCPYAAFKKRCCELNEGIQRLYERLRGLCSSRTENWEVEFGRWMASCS